MFVPNFVPMSHNALVLGPENHLKSLVSKAVLFKNGLNMAKLFRMVIYLKVAYPFIPTNPLLAAISFSFFFLPKSCAFF